MSAASADLPPTDVPVTPIRPRRFAAPLYLLSCPPLSASAPHRLRTENAPDSGTARAGLPSSPKPAGPPLDCCPQRTNRAVSSSRRSYGTRPGTARRPAAPGSAHEQATENPAFRPDPDRHRSCSATGALRNRSVPPAAGTPQTVRIHTQSPHRERHGTGIPEVGAASMPRNTSLPNGSRYGPHTPSGESGKYAPVRVPAGQRSHKIRTFVPIWTIPR